MKDQSVFLYYETDSIPEAYSFLGFLTLSTYVPERIVIFSTNGDMCDDFGVSLMKSVIERKTRTIIDLIVYKEQENSVAQLAEIMAKKGDYAYLLRITSRTMVDPFCIEQMLRKLSQVVGAEKVIPKLQMYDQKNPENFFSPEDTVERIYLQKLEADGRKKIHLAESAKAYFLPSLTRGAPFILEEQEKET